jgi:hypothetical protein
VYARYAIHEPYLFKGALTIYRGISGEQFHRNKASFLTDIYATPVQQGFKPVQRQAIDILGRRGMRSTGRVVSA